MIIVKDLRLSFVVHCVLSYDKYGKMQKFIYARKSHRKHNNDFVIDDHGYMDKP